MQYKDLNQRCTIEMKPRTNFTKEEERRVVYFKPETVFLEEPDVQQRYRQQILRKVGEVGKPCEVELLGNKLYQEMTEAIADRSDPPLMRSLLYRHYTRRQYQLQHLKYKMLQRWAHHNLSS